MKLGRIRTPGSDVEQLRLVAALLDDSKVIDLAKSCSMAREAQSATADAARRLAAAQLPSSMATAIAAGPAFLEAARWAVGRAAIQRCDGPRCGCPA